MDTCSICSVKIDQDRTLPLCDRCMATAKAAGKQAANDRRYPDPSRWPSGARRMD